MSIHSEHPFATPEAERDPLRRFRGRAVAPVSVVAAGAGRARAGWTVSSFLVADGDPGEVLGLLDADSDLADLLVGRDAPARSDPAGPGATVTVNLLGWADRGLADAFAGQAPAPGGTFRLGSWTDSDWGPVLAGGPGWLGVRLRPGPLEHAGWALLVRGSVEHVALGPLPADGLLAHSRGRYRPVGAEPTREPGAGASTSLRP